MCNFDQSGFSHHLLLPRFKGESTALCQVKEGHPSAISHMNDIANNCPEVKQFFEYSSSWSKMLALNFNMSGHLVLQ